MSHTAYPGDADYEAFVVASGQVVPDGYSYTGIGAMVSSAFEQEMGYIPFLQDSVASLRTYNPPGNQPVNKSFSYQYGGGRVLQLGAALQDATAIVSVTSNTQVIAASGYTLKPQNAPSSKRPYNRLEFVCPQWGPVNSIAILAKWGVQQILSEDVWQGLLRLGGSIVAIDILEGIRTGTVVVQQGSEKFQFNPDLLAQMGTSWQNQAMRLLQPYKNTNVGINN